MFPIAALLSGIPVFSIIIRYNLINEGVPKLWANMFAVVFPWAVSLFFYAGEGGERARTARDATAPVTAPGHHHASDLPPPQTHLHTLAPPPHTHTQGACSTP